MDSSQWLPPPDQRSRSAPTSGGAVFRRFREAIETIDGGVVIDGYAAMFGAFLVPGTLFMLFHQLSTISDESVLLNIFFLAFCLLALAISINFLRFDFVGYRYHPVLFDRASRQVHVFSSAMIDIGKFWEWGRQPFRIDSYPWDCIRADVGSVLAPGGLGTPRAQYSLVFRVTDAPGSDNVVASFSTGMSSVYDGGAEPAALWEHLRRFMQEGGPHLSPGDTLYTDVTRQSLWASLWWLQPLLGPGSREFWLGPLWYFTIPFGVLVLPLVPFTFVGGFLRWLAWHCKAIPRWPAHILDAVGPELDANGREIANARVAVSAHRERIDPR